MGLPALLKRPPAAFLLLGAITAVRAVAAALVPLTPEEAYHWTFAVRLDWSYYDHPPMIAWGIALGRALFGDTPWGVRFMPLVWGTATAALLAREAARLYGPAAASRAVLLLALEPIVLAAGSSAFPDAPLFFFWTLSLTWTWRAIESEHTRLWMLSGIALGAALLSKYTAVFLPLSVLLYLLFSPTHRNRLTRPGPYLAAALALAVFSPVLFWNAAHDWVSFRYQSVNRFEQMDGVRLVAGLKFIGQQWLGVVPLTLPLAIAAARRMARSDRPSERFLLACALPMLGFFFVLGWTRPIHLLWPAPAWLPLTIAMAGAIARPADALERFYDRRRAALAGAAGVALLAGAAHAAFFLPGFSPFQGLYGWREAARAARDVHRTLPPDAFYLGLGRKYTVPSQLSFHLGPSAEVHGKNLLGLLGLQFDFWADPQALTGRDAVVVLEAGDRTAHMKALLAESFERVEPAGECVIPVGRRTLRREPPVRFLLFRARGYRPPSAALGLAPP
jgi:4-amino-4-deoxy-L-arabinose transferase-like glycosyltransferase